MFKGFRLFLELSETRKPRSTSKYFRHPSNNVDIEQTVQAILRLYNTEGGDLKLSEWLRDCSLRHKMRSQFSAMGNNQR